ncbi:hypothetical protein CR513_02739, partial [Mucuna pruriens]
MKRIFLEKFFLVSSTATIRKEIYGIRQHSGETLNDYWERFNKLCATCPHHQINEQLLIQYFYEGLMMMDRSMIDAVSGGALMDKTPTVVRNLISNMANNTQQFRTRGNAEFRGVNEATTMDSQRLENKIIELTSLVRQLAIVQHHTSPSTKVCGIYTFVEHPTDALRKARKIVVNNSSSSDLVIYSNQLSINISASSSNILAESGQMENNDRTLKELATPYMVYQSWCIQYPQLEPAQTYELKSGLIHLLPKFHGRVGEDPHKHLKESPWSIP